MSAIDRLFSLEGRIALITGAAGVQGQMFARTLGEVGAAIIAVDKDAAAAKGLCAQLGREGIAAQAEGCDITQPADVEELAEKVRARQPRLDILVNNAGAVSPGRATHEVSPDDWARLISVNLTGAFLMIRAFIPLLRQSQAASIINNASILAIAGLFPGFAMVNAPYAAAKAGLLGLTRQVAAEYAAENIRCNAIAPGWHSGSGIQRSLDLPEHEWARFEAVVANGVPMKRRGRMEELRGLMVWLASDASSYVTGQTIVQDGGWTAV